MSRMWIVGGPNGAGKTSLAFTLMPDLIECDEYVSADAIAAGLSPFHAEAVALRAGRVMLERIRALVATHANFAVETTLAALTPARLAEEARACGYRVTLLYVWLRSADLAVARVRQRHATGGHFVPEGLVRRRHPTGARHFLGAYIAVVDDWVCYDNSGTGPVPVASGRRGEAPMIVRPSVWREISECATSGTTTSSNC